MQSARKFGAFALAPDETIMVAGTLGGEVVVIGVDTFEVVGRQRAHDGAIEVVAAHPRLPYFAAMSMDRSVSLFERTGDTLRFLDRFRFRDTPCGNDDIKVPAAYSLSQALAFHPTDKRLAVRSGNAGVLELDFGQNQLTQRHCTRFHGDMDLVTLCYANSDGDLISASAGHAVLSRDGVELRSWRLGNYNLHWFEPLGDDEYLIACDELYVIRLDLQNRYEPFHGHRLTRDDLEHVTYNRRSGRAFVAGFDGTVYEIDPQTCDYRQVAWAAPYKLRWIKTLDSAPDTLIAHCFNGGLYKVDLARGLIVDCIKQTPDTIWTAVRAGNLICFAGEGSHVGRLEYGLADQLTGEANLQFGDPIRKVHDGGGSYTKRMVQGADGLLLAQKDGRIIEIGGHNARLIVQLDEELRDIASVPGKSLAYVCTERGHVYGIDTVSGDIVSAYRSPTNEPVWSLAYHAKRDLVAFAERRGELVICHGADLRRMTGIGGTSRPKRMKWCDDTLIYVQTCELRRYDLGTNQVSHYVDDCGNTIEDFIWDDERDYLVLVNYRTELVLCDFSTGNKLSIVPDQADFSKGVIWMNAESGYRRDLATFGRSGQFHRFRIHNERLMAMGPLVPVGKAS